MINNRIFKPLPGKIVFSSLFIALIVYTIPYLAGNILKNHTLNLVGAICFFCIILFSNLKRIWSNFRLDKIAIVGLIMISLPAILICYGLMTNDWSIDMRDFSKHVGLILFFLLFRALAIPPPYLFPNRRNYIYLFVFMIIISFLLPESQVLDDTRVSGIGVNANSFALTIIPLLLFVSPTDNSKFKSLIHFLVVIALLKSKTLGALLGYVAGLLYLVSTPFGKRSNIAHRKRIGLISLLLVVGVTIFYIQVGDSSLSERARKQIELFRTIGYDTLQNVPVNYDLLSKEYGGSALSGIWRLEHWTQIMTGINQSSLFHKLFGNGFRYSDMTYDAMPHNEYLRYLLEQGIFGLFLLILLYIHIYRKLPYNIRYIYVIYFVFSFSENNMSNLYAVALFMLAASSSKKYWVKFPYCQQNRV